MFASRPYLLSYEPGRVGAWSFSHVALHRHELCTAFPAPSSPDHSEAGLRLRLRISVLFWLTIRKSSTRSRRLLVVSYRAPRSRLNRIDQSSSSHRKCVRLFNVVRHARGRVPFRYSPSTFLTRPSNDKFQAGRHHPYMGVFERVNRFLLDRRMPILSRVNWSILSRSGRAIAHDEEPPRHSNGWRISAV